MHVLPCRYNITHMVLDDTDQRRWDVTFLNAYARRSATNGPYSVYRVVPQKFIDPPVVRAAAGAHYLGRGRGCAISRYSHRIGTHAR